MRVPGVSPASEPGRPHQTGAALHGRPHQPHPPREDRPAARGPPLHRPEAAPGGGALQRPPQSQSGRREQTSLDNIQVSLTIFYFIDMKKTSEIRCLCYVLW